jgi:hypothetical protein
VLHLYRRHQAPCKSRNPYHKKCCFMWARGIVEGAAVPHSLETRSWEHAEQLKREIEFGKRAEPVGIDFARTHSSPSKPPGPFPRQRSAS